MDEAVRTIYVDLDRGLLRINLLEERLLLAVVRNPLMLVRAIVWFLLGGRTRLKMEIARRSMLDVVNLPFNEDLVAYLKEEQNAGLSLVLAAGAPFDWAQAVSLHLGIFDRVLATDNAHGNLKGRRKLAVIEEDSGGKPFGYAGEAASNRPIFEASQLPIVVGGGARLSGKQAERAVVIPRKTGGLGAWWKALHPHQWCKNLLVFVPMIAAHRLHGVWQEALLAFAAFSLVASACYLLNDFCDIDDDRRHAERRSNALASGVLPPILAQTLGAFLLVAAAGAALFLPLSFGLVLGCYGIVNVLYSTTMKNIVIVDLLALTFLYLLRVLAGDAACEIDVSLWLLGFIFFLSLSLAQLKRYNDLTVHINEGIGWEERPNYKAEDRALLMKTGLSSGLISILIFGLFATSPRAYATYRTPELLFLICGLLFYWIERLWKFGRKEIMTGDPVAFMVTDRASYVVALAATLVVWMAWYC